MNMEKSKSVKRHLIEIVIIAMIGAAAIALLSGCATMERAGTFYSENVAPIIPTVGVEASVGGSGIGGGISFQSRWVNGERKRSVNLSPKINPEKLKESINGDTE